MSFWDNLPPAAKNLRLLDPIIGWVKYEDVLDDEGKITAKGSHVGVDAALSNSPCATSSPVRAECRADFSWPGPADNGGVYRYADGR